MGRRLTAQEKQRRAKAAAKAKEPLDPRYDANPREAARAIDGEAYRARGETPPWEEEEEEDIVHSVDPKPCAHCLREAVACEGCPER